VTTPDAPSGAGLTEIETALARYMLPERAHYITEHALAPLLAAREDAAKAEHRDLVSRLGFGDGITEPMADNDTVIRHIEEERDRLRDYDDLHHNGCPEDCPEFTEERDWGDKCLEHNRQPDTEPEEGER